MQEGNKLSELANMTLWNRKKSHHTWILSPGMPTTPCSGWELRPTSTAWCTASTLAVTPAMPLPALTLVTIPATSFTRPTTAYSSAPSTTITTHSTGTVPFRTALAGGWTGATPHIWTANTTKVRLQGFLRFTAQYVWYYHTLKCHLMLTFNSLRSHPFRWHVHCKGRRWIWLWQRHYLGHVARPLVLAKGDHHEAHPPQPPGNRWAAVWNQTVWWTWRRLKSGCLWSSCGHRKMSL